MSANKPTESADSKPPTNSKPAEREKEPRPKVTVAKAVRWIRAHCIVDIGGGIEDFAYKYSFTEIRDAIRGWDGKSKSNWKQGDDEI